MTKSSYQTIPTFSPGSNLINIKIGYTQGELQAEYQDYDDGFRGCSHVLWYFTVINDENSDYPFILINWKNPESVTRYSSDEELAEAVGQICEDTTEDMFGSVIKGECFESLVMALFDEPEGYPCMENVLDEIGGEIVVTEDTDKIPQYYVNSLFAIFEDLRSHEVSVKGGKIQIGNSPFDPKSKYESSIKSAAFTEDVMRYES